MGCEATLPKDLRIILYSSKVVLAFVETGSTQVNEISDSADCTQLVGFVGDCSGRFSYFARSNWCEFKISK